jgi:hypothetical protein
VITDNVINSLVTNFAEAYLHQQFSTWGMLPLRVREKVTRGTRKLKNCPKEALLGRIFDLGVCEGHIILIWGYAEGKHFDLGVRGYQKIENP